MVVAEKYTLGNPVEQTIGQHQVMGEVRVAVEGLGQELLAVEGIGRRNDVAGSVLQERREVATGGRVCTRQIDARVRDGQWCGGIGVEKDRLGRGREVGRFCLG